MKKLTAVTLSLCFVLGAVSCSAESEPSKAEETTVLTESETASEIMGEEVHVSETLKETESSASEAVNTDYVEPYIRIIKANMADNTSFALIHINDDEIPELVISVEGFWVSLYTMVDGKLCTPMEQCPYGVMGNTGYSYSPRKNVIRNDNTENAGAIRYETMMSMDDEGVIEPVYVGTIKYLEEVDGEEQYLVDPYFYIDNKPVSRKEYEAIFTEDMQERLIIGNMTSDEIISALENGEIPEEHSYEVVDADVSWSEAAELAKAKGGYLATITTSDEYMIISRLFMDYNIVTQIFIVGGRRYEDRAYVWSEDKSFELIDGSLWRSGEPSYEGWTEGNQRVTEDKVVMLDGQYMDVPDDLLAAAPSYHGAISYIIEYDHCN